MRDTCVILHQFEHSHFNEKARWGLDWQGIVRAFERTRRALDFVEKQVGLVRRGGLRRARRSTAWAAGATRR